MNDLERWQEIADRDAVGDALTDDELELLAAPADALARHEQAAYEALIRSGEPGLLDPADLERVRDALHARTLALSSSRRRVTRAGIAILAIAAAVGLVWLARPSPEAVSPVAQGPTVTRGSLAFDTLEVGVGEVASLRRWATAKTPTCFHSTGLTACTAGAAKVRLFEDHIELAEGTLHVEGNVTVVSGLLSASATRARFEVSASDAETTVAVESGSVFLQTDTTTRSLGPGERWPPGVFAQSRPQPLAPVEPAPLPAASPNPARPAKPRPPSSPTPAELLTRARSLVGEGKPEAALRTYAKLRRQHPASSAAKAANVSMGQLYLQRGRAKQALAAFSRYLAKGGGTLAEEALWGTIQAHHKLGRATRRDAAVATLQRRFPRSVYLRLASEL